MSLSVLDVYRVKGRGLMVTTDELDQKVHPGDVVHRGDHRWEVLGVERSTGSTIVALNLKDGLRGPELRKGQALVLERVLSRAQSAGEQRIARSEDEEMTDQAQPTNGNGAGENEEAKKPTLTKTQKKALFDAADKAGKKEADAERVLKAAQAEKSAAIKKIYDALGKGPFKWKDEVLTITKRGETYFFRGRMQTDVEDID